MFSNNTLVHDNAPPYTVWLQKVQRFTEYCLGEKKWTDMVIPIPPPPTPTPRTTPLPGGGERKKTLAISVGFWKRHDGSGRWALVVSVDEGPRGRVWVEGGIHRAVVPIHTCEPRSLKSHRLLEHKTSHLHWLFAFYRFFTFLHPALR